MVSAEAARNVVGIIGNFVSLFLFLSPCPTFYRIWKKKSVEEFQAYPYLATVLNCLMWIMYGLPVVHPDSTLVVSINGFGLVVELIYLSLYFTYAPKKGRMKVVLTLLIEVIFTAAVMTGVILGLHTHKKRSLVLGVICDVFNIIMYGMPLSIMKKVVTTKSVEYMPFFLSLTGFLNGCIWTAYALIKFDIYLLISNGLGAILGAVQLVLYTCYYKSTPTNVVDAADAKKPNRPKIQLSGSNNV